MLPAHAPLARTPASPLRRLPKGVREVIGARLNALTPPCLDLLQRAAVIGRQFPVALLSRLADEAEARRSALPGPAARGARCQPGRREQRRRHLDVLAHAGARCAVRRAAGCATPGAAPACGRSPGAAARRRHHASRCRRWPTIGTRPAIRRKAIEYATRAAQRATAMLAHEEAVRHYRLAAETLPAAASHDARRCRLLLSLGEAQNSAGDSRRVAAHLRPRGRACTAAWAMPACLPQRPSGSATPSGGKAATARPP